MQQDTAESTPMHVLEGNVPLFDSMVWRLQRTFYGDQGIAAWSQSGVPQSVTTSPIIARTYARIMLAYWQDIRSTLDPSQPIYIVELGAGSGRFAYRFLTALSALLADFPDARGRFRYVMTDASPSVVSFWRDNPRLRRFVEAGLLDFAHFDLLDLTPPELLNSGTALRVREVANPIVLIGNYIFDSVPQSAYTIKDGQLFRSLVTITASEPTLDLRAEDSRVRIGIKFTHDDVATDVADEQDPLLREILDGYRQRLGDTSVLIPKAGMACVRFFADLAGQRGLCLIGDFGDVREDDLRDHGPPGIGAGGGLWLAVNFHALGEYARLLGGRARHPHASYISLNVSMLLFGPPGAEFPETELAYGDTIDRHSPDGLFIESRALVDQAASLEFMPLLSLMRLTGWDSDFVLRCVPRLIEVLPTVERRFHDELVQGVELAWEQYYPIGESDDLPFGLGAVLYTLGQFPRALEFFDISLEQFGQDPRATLNKALTLYRLQRLPEALEWVDQTLALDPSNELATEMRSNIAAEMAGAD